MRRFVSIITILLLKITLVGVNGFLTTEARGAEVESVQYKVLATSKTSTMQKEMNEAADEGFRFEGVMGGNTGFGGSEVVVIMSRREGSVPQFEYRLLATSKTSTMQKELQEVGDAGYIYRGQTVFSSAFGGSEAVVILERDRDAPEARLYEYLLLATSKTSTMQKELTEAGGKGFKFVGVTVGSTKFGGSEVVCILHRKYSPSESDGEDQ